MDDCSQRGGGLEQCAGPCLRLPVTSIAEACHRNHCEGGIEYVQGIRI